MRNVGSTIITAERQQAVRPTHAAVAQDELLAFAAFGSTANGSLEKSVPASYAMRTSGALAYVAFRYTNGTSYIRVIDTSNSGDFGLPGGTSHTYPTMRSCVLNETGVMRAYTADMGAGGVQVKRATLSSTTNNVSVSWSDFGPAFGPAFANGSTLVRRVEAVCPTSGGALIVAVGTHDFVAGLSTIQFWAVRGTAAIQLNTIIQAPLTESWPSNYYGFAKWASFISAIYDDNNARTIIVASDQPRGRAVLFTLQNGVESSLRPLIPIDAEATSLSLVPASLVRLAGRFYLTARFARTTPTGSGMAFDCYLTSADGLNWSFGERSSFLTQSTLYGALLMRTDSPSVVVYCGNGVALTAPVTENLDSASTKQLTLDDYIESWSLDQVSNGADKLSMTLAQGSGAGGAGVLDGNANLKRGAVVYLRSGQGGTLADVGAYGIDAVAETITTGGRGLIKITARDLASKKLVDTKFPLDIVLESHLRHVKTLTKDDDLARKTEDRNLKFGANGLAYEGLNDPFIALSEAAENGDVLIKTTVSMDGDDAYHLSSLGFIFGATEAGAGNVALVPKVNSWNEGGAGVVNAPAVRRLNLTPIDTSDPDKENTGYKMTEGLNHLWRGPVSNGVRTAALSLSGRTTGAYSVPVTVYTDLAFRLSGRRVQVYARQHPIAANWGTNAPYTLVAEYLFTDTAKRSQAGRDYCGLALSTDVWADTDALADTAYDTVEQSLTDAGNYATPPVNGNGYEWTNLMTAASTESPQDDRRDINVVSTAGLIVGQWVRLSIPTYSENLLQIQSIVGNNIKFTSTFAITAGVGGATCYVYGLSDAELWGFAASGKIQRVASGVTTIFDPGAQKTPSLMRGMGLFVADNSSATVSRFLQSDGVLFGLLSGDINNGRVGWDATNPLPSTSPSQFYGGSDPATWKVIFWPGYCFNGSPASKYLPASGYIRVGKERMRYAAFTFWRRGMLSQTTLTLVPAYYAPLAAINAGSTTLRNWVGDLGGGSYVQTGDDLGQIPNAVGMCVVVSGRSGSSDKDKKQYYITAQNYVAPGSRNVNNSSSITLDKAFESSTRASSTTAPFTGEGDIAIVSGRGQDGTTIEKHAPTDPALYFPRNASNDGFANIKVMAWESYAGQYLSVEDALKRLASVAGVRPLRFRNRHTSPASDVSTTLSTSAYALPTPENVSNFMLDMRVHVPGNSVSSGAITSAKFLRVGFRGAYRLWIGQYTTATDYANGRPGVIRVGLEDTRSLIPANADGVRWLERADVPESDFNLAGTASGAGSTWTLTEDTNIIHDVRVIVQEAIVAVEINGRPIWTINLDRLNDGGATSYRTDNAGAITVDYSSSPGSYTATLRVVELGEEQRRYTAQRGANVSSAINNVASARRVRTRPTTDGGLEVSRFEVRDDVGSISDNLWQHDYSVSDLTRRAHLLVGGESFGEWIDPSIIATDGYSFDAVSNDSVLTSEAGAIEAKLLGRESAENDQIDKIDGVGFLEIQPEDRLALAYDAPGDGPAHSSTNHVVTAAQLKASRAETVGSYTLRRFVA